MGDFSLTVQVVFKLVVEMRFFLRCDTEKKLDCN